MKLLTLMFEPGCWLMLRLRMPGKLVLMGLCLAAPLLLLISLTWQEERAELHLTRERAEGARAAQALSMLTTGLMQHATLARRTGAGDSATLPELAASMQALRAQLDAVDALLTTMHGPVPTAWAPARHALRQLTDPARAEEPVDARGYAELVALLRRPSGQVAATSGLLFDRDPVTGLLAHLVTDRLPTLAQALMLANGTTAASDAGRLEGADAALAAPMAAVQDSLEALAQAGFSLPSLSLQQAQPGTVTLTVAGHGLVALHQALADHLAERDHQLQALMRRQIWLAALLAAFELYLAVSCWLSFRRGLRTLHQAMAEVSTGRLCRPISIPGRDELAEIGNMLEAMSQRLSAMVTEIRLGAVRVGQDGAQLARGSEALSQRTEEQACDLRQTVVTVGQLSAAVDSNAQSAQAVEQVAAELRRQAEDGGRAMQAAVQTMGGLEASARRVADIIGVIDGIAFQSNVLALNAAVEAARAGQAGRGFAVVASEVRRLAQRSSEAAGEIRRLIDQSSSAVADSVHRIDGVSLALEAVVAGVQDVSQRLRGIAAASIDQSRGLQEMRTSIGHLDALTRQNGRMVDECHDASRSLVAQAEALRDAVASISLRQGSPDEAHALVLRAVALIEAQGLDPVTDRLRDRQQGFVDRDMYIWVVDRQGRYRVHGAKPAAEGQRVHEVPGIDGDRFVREAFEAAADGGGWVDYDILNLETGRVQPKVSFVMPIDDGLVIGCGVYRSATLLPNTPALPAATPAAPPAVSRAAAPRRGGQPTVATA